MSVVSETIGRSLAKIRTLPTATRAKVADTVAAVLSHLGIPMLVYSAGRDYAEQWELRLKYLAGGAKAAAPGYSWHNFGRAVDMVPVLPSGVLDWNSASWPAIISIAQGYGLESGQSFGDTNHFANKAGATLTSLRAANPVPDIYTQLDNTEVPKDIEAKQFFIPGWLLWTAAAGSSAALLYYVTRDKNAA